ncbi:Arm DNA-binding domain-containing protein, partial [Alistipes putredinis]|uniref:Arm DNA-binding domain-containing protein n=2 Tax=Alistipes putredinis TaxID=28117 RepID=UPI003AB453E7
MFLKFDTYSYICSRKNEKGIPMARVKNHTKVKEPIRLRMKSLSNGSKSLYLDIYRDGKRTYEYLKMYIIPETDSNSRRQNQ